SRGSGPVLRHWLDPDWYRFLARRAGPEGLVVFWVAVALGLGVAGFFAVGAIPSGGRTDTYVQVTATVTRLVRVREHGQLVLRKVRVVKRVYAKPVTVQLTHTVQDAG